MNWEVILWTCITIAFLLCVGGIILALISAKNVRKKKETLKDVHTTIKTGSRVMFAGGIYGKVIAVKEDTVLVEISKNVVIEVSRYSIQSIENK